MNDFDIAASCAPNPNYRADIDAHIHRLRRINIDIEKTPEETRAESEYLGRTRSVV